MKNTDLKKTYDKMHHIGKKAWFDDGQEERQAIFDMGAPWKGQRVLEIGCGEADLLDMINGAHAVTSGIDYSLEAITTAKNRYPYLDVMCCNWEEWPDSRNTHFDVIVMQGVIEHLDEPWTSLDAMIAKFTPKTVITSMPCFLNIRGIIWHTLNMLGAVMSKTDLHYIDPWTGREYCDDRKYRMMWNSIDDNWGNGKKMIKDLRERIPLALTDGGLPYASIMDFSKGQEFIKWLEYASGWFQNDIGAIAIYRIDI